jgi:PAS domain S-box-containing protein
VILWLAGFIASCFVGVALATWWFRGERSVAPSAEVPDQDESDFREIVDRVPAMIATASAEGLHDYANKRALDYAGVTLEEMRGIGFLSIIHPDDRERVKISWLQSVSNTQPMDLMHRLRRHDGEYVWFHARVEPTFDEAGKVVRWYGVLNNVDDRKRAEDALLASERMLRQLVEAMPALVWRARPNGEVDFVNERVLEYTGARLEDMVDSAWIDHVHPDDSAEAIRAWRESVSLGKTYDASYRLRRTDGAYRWFQVRGTPMRDEQGEVVNWFGLLVDIDERKKAEQAQQEREIKASRMLESIPAVVWATDPQGRVTYLNRRVASYFAAPSEQLDQMKWADRIHPDDLAGAMQTRNQAIVVGHGYENVFRFRSASGAYRWIHATVEPARDENGEIEAWFGVFFDIDDRLRAEQELQEKERELRLITETIPAFVTSRGLDGRLLYANRRFLAYTGMTLDELAASDDLVIHPDDWTAFESTWQQARADGTSFDVTHRLRSADGSYRWFEVHVLPLFDDKGGVVRWYSLKLDIHDRKRTEEALQIAQMKLSRTTRLVTVAELSASIAHEIHQPLAALVTNGAMCESWLAATPPNFEEARTAAERVVRDGKATVDVVSRIRELFKGVAPSRARIDLNQVADEVLALLKAELASGGVSVVRHFAPDLPATLADRTQLQQVLVNLIRNGMDAMDSLPLDARILTVRTRRDQGALLLEVCDSGGGIREPERLFEPFFTTKQSGMGMGLTICRSIVAAHEGRLWATSNSPSGTVMHVSLPVEQH